ncbi:MAG: IclR family transcriptional regulator, partial [Woeseiaceae bacterium]
MTDKTPPQGAQAALRALRLLKLFTPEKPELRLAEVSALTGLNKTTTHRLLQALQSEQMLDRNPAGGAYRLGTALMALGVQALSSNDLRRRARPLLDHMAKETGETATLEVPIDNSMLILDEVTGSHVVAAAGNVGTRWPIHATSTGKALIAFDDQGL